MIKLTGNIVKVEPSAGRLLCTMELPYNDKLYLIDTKKKYTIELKEARRQRSINANAYAWVLCQMIAEELSKTGYITKEDVYRKAIKDSASADYILIDDAFVDSFTARWLSRGIGWSVEDMGGHPQGRVLAVYAGSSTYNTEEMSRLIECLVDEAKALGIETLDEKDLNSLIETWCPDESEN